MVNNNYERNRGYSRYDDDDNEQRERDRNYGGQGTGRAGRQSEGSYYNSGQGSERSYGSQGYQSSERGRRESDYGGSDYGRAGRGNEGWQGGATEYDMNYRGQGFSSSSQSDRDAYGQSMEADRYRNRGRQQGGFGGPSDYGSRYNDMESDYGYGSRGYGMPSDYSTRSGYGGMQSDYSSRGYGEQSYAGKGPKGWKRSDDRIYEEVCMILERRPDIDPSDVEVKVQNGEVILEGTVRDRNTKRRLDEAVELVAGVHDVQNRVRVQKDNPSTENQSSSMRGNNGQSREMQTSGQSSSSSSTQSKGQNT
jgi:hypothetical protein